MRHEAYAVSEASEDFDFFDFISEGKKGKVRKRVVFAPDGAEGVYNLTLGDVGEDNEIDDRVVTDNGDRDKILATVFEIIDDYTGRFPDRSITIEGSTASRTRLYRMVISIYFEELSSLYEILCYKDKRLIPFYKNGAVDSFLIKRKTL